jgi:hypothetical protein
MRRGLRLSFAPTARLPAANDGGSARALCDVGLENANVLSFFRARQYCGVTTTVGTSQLCSSRKKRKPRGRARRVSPAPKHNARTQASLPPRARAHAATRRSRTSRTGDPRAPSPARVSPSLVLLLLLHVRGNKTQEAPSPNHYRTESNHLRKRWPRRRTPTCWTCRPPRAPPRCAPPQPYPPREAILLVLPLLVSYFVRSAKTTAATATATEAPTAATAVATAPGAAASAPGATAPWPRR